MVQKMNDHDVKKINDPYGLEDKLDGQNMNDPDDLEHEWF